MTDELAARAQGCLKRAAAAMAAIDPATPCLTSDEADVVGAAATDVETGTLDGRAAGGVTRDRVVRAAVIRFLLCDPELIDQARQATLHLYRVAVTGDLLLSELSIAHPVLFEDCQFHGAISAHGLRLPSLTFHGGACQYVNLTRAKIAGELSFAKGAELRGTLDLRGAQSDALMLKNVRTVLSEIAEGVAINALNFETGFLQIQDSTIAGAADFSGALARSEIHIGNTAFGPPRCGADRMAALSLAGAKIQGRCGLTPTVRAAGDVSLDGADIALDCDIGGLQAEGDIVLDGARITGRLRLTGMGAGGVTSLRRTHAGVLDDATPARVLGPGTLRLAGLTYDAIADGSIMIMSPTAWLGARPADFHPQPYEQLAAALRRQGQDDLARQVVVAKQRALRRSGQISGLSRVLNKLSDVLVEYGYSRLRPIVVLACLWIAGSVVFQIAHAEKILIAKPAEETPPFVAPIYSLEMLIPKPDLGIASAYHVAGGGWPSVAVWSWRWIENVVGAFFVILLALTPTKLLGRD